MSTIPGLPVIRILNLPLVGRKSIIARLVDTDNAAFPITNDFNVKAELLANPDEVAILLTKNSNVGEITALNGVGYIYIPLSDADAANLKVGKVYTLRVTLIYVNDGVTIKLVNLFYLIPLNQLFTWSQPTEVLMALSTQFKNTAVSALGEAYLDTILTVNQPVGCQLEIYINAATPPQSWVLQASAVASAAGATRRAVDYSGANQKVWFRDL